MTSKTIASCITAFCLIILLFTGIVQAQPPVKKQSISIAGIEYDNPNFIGLREQLKKNVKIKQLQPAYASGNAILSFVYKGELSQLWDEVPQTYKKFFKLTNLTEDAITLTYTDPKKTTAVASNGKPVDEKGCVDCDYFPLCNNTNVKSFDGKEYAGIRDKYGNMKYYRCEKGEVIMLWESEYTPQSVAAAYNAVTNTETIIYVSGATKYSLERVVILKNAPGGTRWGERGEYYSYLIAEKGISYMVKGITYKDVMVISRNDNEFCYYAKGVGLIDKLDVQDYIIAPGNDKDMFGIWVMAKDQPATYLPAYWQLNPDGTGKTSTIAPPFTSQGDQALKWSMIRPNALRTRVSGSSREYDIKKEGDIITINGIKFTRQK